AADSRADRAKRRRQGERSRRTRGALSRAVRRRGRTESSLDAGARRRWRGHGRGRVGTDRSPDADRVGRPGSVRWSEARRTPRGYYSRQPAGPAPWNGPARPPGSARDVGKHDSRIHRRGWGGPSGLTGTANAPWRASAGNAHHTTPTILVGPRVYAYRWTRPDALDYCVFFPQLIGHGQTEEPNDESAGGGFAVRGST